jgi:cell wall-associated NlpC family hydrolase
MGVTMVLLGGAVPQAMADDPFPSAGRVQRGQEQVRRAAEQVNEIVRRYKAASAEIVALDARAGYAVERYDGAMVKLDQALRAAEVARQQQVEAARRQATATTAVGELAAQAYRAGGLAGLSSLINSDGPASLYARATDLRSLSRVRAQTLRDSVAAQRLAVRRRVEAELAAQAQRRATDAVRAAKDKAQAAVAAQQRQLGQLQAKRERLLAQLAAARRSSLELERKRQQALAEQEAARIAASRPGGAPPPGRRAPGVRPRRLAHGFPFGDLSALFDEDLGDRVNPRVAAVVGYAMAQLGKPYVWGGAGPNSFDCSGLTMRAWERAGVRLNHFAADQYTHSRKVRLGDLRMGDLVFWTRNGAPSGIYHVGIYLGGGRMIEAPRTGDVVKVASLYIMGTPDYFARP